MQCLRFFILANQEIVLNLETITFFSYVKKISYWN